MLLTRKIGKTLDVREVFAAPSTGRVRSGNTRARERRRAAQSPDEKAAARAARARERGWSAIWRALGCHGGSAQQAEAKRLAARGDLGGLLDLPQTGRLLGWASETGEGVCAAGCGSRACSTHQAAHLRALFGRMLAPATARHTLVTVTTEAAGVNPSGVQAFVDDVVRKLLPALRQKVGAYGLAWVVEATWRHQARVTRCACSAPGHKARQGFVYVEAFGCPVCDGTGWLPALHVHVHAVMAHPGPFWFGQGGAQALAEEARRFGATSAGVPVVAEWGPWVASLLGVPEGHTRVQFEACKDSGAAAKAYAAKAYASKGGAHPALWQYLGERRSCGLQGCASVMFATAGVRWADEGTGDERHIESEAPDGVGVAWAQGFPAPQAPVFNPPTSVQVGDGLGGWARHIHLTSRDGREIEVEPRHVAIASIDVQGVRPSEVVRATEVVVKRSGKGRSAPGTRVRALWVGRVSVGWETDPATPAALLESLTRRVYTACGALCEVDAELDARARRLPEAQALVEHVELMRLANGWMDLRRVRPRAARVLRGQARREVGLHATARIWRERAHREATFLALLAEARKYVDPVALARALALVEGDVVHRGGWVVDEGQASALHDSLERHHGAQ